MASLNWRSAVLWGTVVTDSAFSRVDPWSRVSLYVRLPSGVYAIFSVILIRLVVFATSGYR